MSDHSELQLQFVLRILEGSKTLGDDGIKGQSDYETRQKRAEWMTRRMPKTAHMFGLQDVWDGIGRFEEKAKK